MEYLNLINTIDTELFLLINGLHNSFFDGFMYSFSKVGVWIPFYISVIYILIKNAGKQALWMIVALILCVVLADQISSGIIKESVQRLRPTHNPSLNGLVHIVAGYKGGLYGFVSSHAANTFGFALLSSLLIRKRVYIVSVFSWAFITSYSRMYLGVHYPLDILGGALVGFFVAVFCFVLLKKIMPQLQTTAYSAKSVNIPVIVLLLSAIGISFYSVWAFIINV